MFSTSGWFAWLVAHARPVVKGNGPERALRSLNSIAPPPLAGFARASSTSPATITAYVALGCYEAEDVPPSDGAELKLTDSREF